MRIYVDLRDWWIGYYRGPHHHYVCLLPTVVIRWPRGDTNDQGGGDTSDTLGGDTSVIQNKTTMNETTKEPSPTSLT